MSPAGVALDVRDLTTTLFLREGRVDARKIISHRFPLEKAAKAYDIFSDKSDGCIKCVLMPHGEA